MSHYDASQAEVLVFTFKEGALSALAHDLKLRVTRLELDQEAGQLTASFDPTSLQVICARKDGRDDPAGLATRFHGEIEKNLVTDVLEAKKFPQLRFASTSVTPTEVVGQLTLHGVTRELRCTRGSDGRVEARLDQRDFGIKPYRAMLGTLKVKPEVVVTVRLL